MFHYAPIVGSDTGTIRWLSPDSPPAARYWRSNQQNKIAVREYSGSLSDTNASKAVIKIAYTGTPPPFVYQSRTTGVARHRPQHTRTGVNGRVSGRNRGGKMPASSAYPPPECPRGENTHTKGLCPFGVSSCPDRPAPTHNPPGRKTK